MLLALFLACSPDLPVGWEDAEPIPEFTQQACEGNPYEPFEPMVTANLVGGAIEVLYDQAHFRCAQSVEGYAKMDGDLLSILVQPIDMDPEAVAGCDCLYTLDMRLEVEAQKVSMYQRGDNLNDPNEPTLVGDAEVVEGPT